MALIAIILVWLAATAVDAENPKNWVDNYTVVKTTKTVDRDDDGNIV